MRRKVSAGAYGGLSRVLSMPRTVSEDPDQGLIGSSGVRSLLVAAGINVAAM